MLAVPPFYLDETPGRFVTVVLVAPGRRGRAWSLGGRWDLPMKLALGRGNLTSYGLTQNGT